MAKKFNLLKEAFSTKKLISIVLILAILVFNSYLLDKYDSVVVWPVFSTLKNSLVTSFSLLLASCGFVVIFIYWFRKRVLIDFSTSIFSIFFLIIYCYFRFISNRYSFLPYGTYLKYSDFILLISIGLVLLKIREILVIIPNPKYLDNAFLIDYPIENWKSDLLGRNRFAVKLSKTIQSKPAKENEGALAIGVLGPWGSGKTSFANMILNDLPKNDRLIIRFNPWLNSSPEQIIDDFFNLLTNEVSKYDSNISTKISSYAKTIIDTDKSSILSKIFSISEESSKGNLYEKVNQNLQRIKKQVIIFIDDLDRLDKKEIIEVLRLIRNTANFKNITYIVAYDKKYVQEAVKAFNPHNYSYFLEKIFQFEFELPLYESREIRKFIQMHLIAKLKQKFHPQVEFILNERCGAFDLTNKVIQTHRDAIRFINSFCFEFQEIEHDVYLYDFYLTHLFKLKYNFVVNDLIEKWDIFLITDYEKMDSGFLRLRRENERNLTGNDYQLMMMIGFRNDRNSRNNESSPFIFHEYIEEVQTKNDLSKFDVSIIKNIIEELLDLHKEIPESENEKHQMFAYPKNFYKYFSLQLLYNEIPSHDFENSRTEKYPTYELKLDEWLKESIFPLIDKLFSVKSFHNKVEYENHLKAMFKVGRYLMDAGKLNLFDFAYLSSIFKYQNGKELYSELEFETLFLSLFNSKSVAFESSVIEYIIAKESEFPISFEKLSEHNLNYLKTYLNKLKKVDSLSLILYKRCLVKSQEYHVIISAEAGDFFSDFSKKNLNACDLGLFIEQNDLNSDSYRFRKNSLRPYFKDVRF